MSSGQCIFLSKMCDFLKLFEPNACKTRLSTKCTYTDIPCRQCTSVAKYSQVLHNTSSSERHSYKVLNKQSMLISKNM